MKKLKNIPNLEYIAGVTEDIRVVLDSGRVLEFSINESKEIKKIMKYIIKANASV